MQDGIKNKLFEKEFKKLPLSCYEIEGNKIRYTTSIGVTALQAREDKDTLFKRADSALYQAKNNGRNRVVLN